MIIRKYWRILLAAAIVAVAFALLALGLGWLKTGFSNKQYTALRGTMDAASNASAALAGEDFSAWQKARPDLGAAIVALGAVFGPDAFNGAVKTALSTWPALEKATDFPHARSAYTRVSDNLAQIALACRKQDPRFAKILVYYCPMTTDPADARWVQNSGALRNPFWGKEMLDCGGEIKPD
jgi:hypothetical protein